MSHSYRKPASSVKTATVLLAILASAATLACDELAQELEGIAAPNFGADPEQVFEGMAKSVFGDVKVEPMDEAGHLALSIGEDGEQIEVDFSDLEDWVDQGVSVLRESMTGGIQFDGETGDEGFRVRLRSPDGSAVLEAKIDDEGGLLRISDEAREAFLGVGEEAVRMPRWVPVYPGAEVHKKLFSYNTGDVSSGGIVLSSEAGGEEIREWYEEQLGEGSAVKVSTASSRGNGERYRARIVGDDGEDGGSRISIVVSQDGDENALIMVVYKAVE